MASIAMASPGASREKGFCPQAWATEGEMARISSGTPLGDIVLAEGVGVSLRPLPDFGDQRNANVCIVGGSGSGKTRVIEYNLASHWPATNLIVTDTKGELEAAMRDGFLADGYEVVTLNTVEPSEGARFDPLLYVQNSSDVPAVARAISESVNPDRMTTRTDTFWVLMEDCLLEALIGALLAIDRCQRPGRPRACTFRNLLRLFALARVSDGDRERSPLDSFFDILADGRVGDPLTGSTLLEFDSSQAAYAVTKYRGFRTGAEATLKSVLITVQATLNCYQTQSVQRFLSGDDLEIGRIDQGRRVVFLRMSDNDGTFSFLGRLVMRMLLHLSLRQADGRPGGRLDRQLMFVMDEFANLGPIDGFERMISIVRSRGIALLLCIQSIGQLEHVYGEARANIILDCCDSFAYLGGGSSCRTPDYVSRLCGEAVLGTQLVGDEGTRSEIRGAVASGSEIGQMPRSQVIVKVSGKRPFRGEKPDITRHPNYERFVKLRD